jgi:hypothetical protein
MIGVAEATDLADLPILAKPFSLGALLTNVRRLLA